MEYTTLKIDLDADRIATVSIDVPGRSMNVWNRALIDEFGHWVERFIADPEVRGAVIVSGKPNAFHTGADIDLLLEGNEGHADSLDQVIARLSASLRALESGGRPAADLLRGKSAAKPVAVAIEGLALGGGLELALACHYRVAADGRGVALGLPEIQLGLLPGAGGLQRVLRLSGLKVAADLCLDGRQVSAQQALKYGLVNEVVPAEAARAAAHRWVKANTQAVQPWDRAGYEIPGGAGPFDSRAVLFFTAENAKRQTGGNQHQPAVRAILSCLYQGMILPLDGALAFDAKSFKSLMRTAVPRNMIGTLFVGRKRLRSGVQPADGAPRQAIRTVGVVGAGLMGSGIALVSAMSGMNVMLLDREQALAERGKEGIVQRLAERVKRGALEPTALDVVNSRIAPISDLAKLADADLVIEAVYEDSNIKAQVIRDIQPHLRPDAIFASNTSTIPIRQLATHSARPERFLGLHFFSPVDRMSLVEVIPGDADADVVAAALDYVGRIKKTPIIVSDVRGFYTNRIMPVYLAEAMRMVSEGVNPALIENAALQFGMPIGPLALIDETALTLNYQLMETTRRDLGDAYVPLGHEAMLEKMVRELGRQGRRGGGGFYEYPEKAPKRIWPALREHFPLMPTQPSVEDVESRLVYSQLLPALRCLAEGIVRDVESADLAAILGWGFPAWTGGPITHIRTLGRKQFEAEAYRLTGRYGARFQVDAAMAASLANW